MTDSKAAVQENIEKQVVEATAMVVAPRVAEASQLVMREEIEASHLKNMGMMAIENAIDEDKAIYEAQLDEIRLAIDKANGTVNENNKVLDRAVNTFKSQLIRTELRKRQATSLKILNSLAGLDAPFRISTKSDEGIGVGYHAPNAEADKPEEVKGFFSWQYTVYQGTREYSAPHVCFSGRRNLDKKCVVAISNLDDAKKDVVSLTKLNRDIRMKIQGLERERRELQRKLRHEIVSNSKVGAQFEETLRQSRKKVKALPLPAKFRK